MRQTKLFALPVYVLAVQTVFAIAYADDGENENLSTTYKVVKTITIPETNLSGVFDISWVDSQRHQYYLTDRGAPTANPAIAARIDVIDTRHDSFLYSIKLPLPITGNGVVAIGKSGDDDEEEGGGELWVGASDSTAKVIDLKTKSIVASVPTKQGGNQGTGRADELAYDPIHHLILIANDRDNPPFLSFLSTKTRTQVGSISYPQAVFVDKGKVIPTNHGLEQPVWNPKTRKFYQAVPATSTNPNGEIDEIDPVTMMITDVFPTICNPAGLALLPGQNFMTSCGDTLNLATRKVNNTPGVSADEIWFNPGDDRVYFGGFVGSAVVNGLSPYNLIGSLPWTGHFSPLPAQFSHSIAADSENNHIFVPITNVGVMVFTETGGEGSDH